jgi:phospholipid/cholesterol/gamma-HCH transport system ATP-binding protein
MTQPNPGPDTVVQFDKVSKRFGALEVLNDVSFDIPKGKAFCLLGRSGTGKSVTLKTMIGLVRPTQGQVLFDSQDMSTLDEHALAHVRTRFGFLFQGAALFDSMTVGQNVAFPLREHTQVSEGQIQEAVLSRLAEVGLPENVLSKKPVELSGGMRKRVGLARALALSPELMLYDEPTTGLDPIMSDVINELIVQARDRRPITAIVVTHDMVTVGRTVDRVIMLYPLPRLEANERQIVFDGSPAAVFSAAPRPEAAALVGVASSRSGVFFLSMSCSASMTAGSCHAARPGGDDSFL